MANTEDTKEQVPTILKIYGAINDVIGGTNPNELLCMTMPGMVLNADNYSYDTNFEKPFKVAANESRLVNKLYDPVKVVGSDNGRLLGTQFKTALDSLTPKINRVMIEAKNQLRKILAMPTSYTLDNGQVISMSFQQLFYKLYEEYVDEKQKWTQLQNDKRNELIERFPGETSEARWKREDEYLIWYQTVAEANLLKVNMKHGKVLGLFSDNDMKIIEGILDSGVGAELQEAREQVTNSRKFDPDGGYVYPVKLEPSDWFKSLNTNFSFIDLLESSEHYGLKYQSALKKRNALANQIQLFEVSDRSAHIDEAMKKMESARLDCDKATQELDKVYGDGFSVGVNAIVQMVKSSKKKKEDFSSEEKDKTSTLFKEDAKQRNVQNTENENFSFDKIFDTMAEIDKKQRAFDSASMKLTDAESQLVLDTTKNYSKELKTLYLNLKEANEELEMLREKMNAAIIKEDGKLNEKLFPDALAGRFMQVNVSTNKAEMSQSSDEVSHAAKSSIGVNFLFGGYHSSSAEESAQASETLDEASFSMDIGFLATKISITRNWFNPGVFLLTDDMYHTTSKRISNGDVHSAEAAGCIFPCYPTAMVLAKDVSIKITTSNNHVSSMKSIVDSHASKGGGFLCFKADSSSSDHESHSAMSTSSSGNSVIIKIPGPQVIGYYLQSTPKDNSRQYINKIEDQDVDVMITDFIKSYQVILEERSN